MGVSNAKVCGRTPVAWAVGEEGNTEKEGLGNCQCAKSNAKTE